MALRVLGEGANKAITIRRAAVFISSRAGPGIRKEYDKLASMTVGSPGPAPKRSRSLPPALAANIWKRGQSGNPSGQSGLYGETVMLARRAAPDVMRRLIELMRSEDERVASVACNTVLQRAFGKPREFDPATEEKPDRYRDRWDPSKYTIEELEQIRAALRLMAEDRSGRPPASEPEIPAPGQEDDSE
jgi:hypothetical protein